MKSPRVSFLLTFFIALTLFAGNAYAYLDPATGSIVLQTIVAAFIGIAAVLRLFWGKVRAFFHRVFYGMTSARDGEPRDVPNE